MTIQVTGVLTDSSGTPSPNTPLKFVTVQGYAGTLRTATFDDITGNDGSYDFPLATGKHVIYVKYGGRYEEIGSTIINSETPSPLSISELLNQTEPLTSDEMLIVRELVSQAQDSANRAATSAAAALVSENAAEASELAAAASKNAAATSATNAATSASNASTSASAASTSQTAAANSATAADAYASAAFTSATNASESANTATQQAALAAGSATSAATSASSASTSATNAAAAAAAAAVSATEANTAKAGAKAEADRAELAASQATQVSGLETVEQAVSQALADGGYTWRTEADMQHERAVNNEMFAASGFVHFGKHYPISTLSNVINDGMWTHPSAGKAELLHLGRRSTDGLGRSKTDAPYVNIAGFVTELNANAFKSGDSDYDAFSIKFPEAEAGTRVYDSVTGVSIDYAKEIDPKYGDIAPDHNEAVARAFEGVVKNGDFRLGDNGDWSLSSGGLPVIANNRLRLETIDVNDCQATVAMTLVPNTEYTIRFYMNDKAGILASGLRLRVGSYAGSYSLLQHIINDVEVGEYHEVTFTSGDYTNTYFSVLLSTTGPDVYAEISDISINKTTSKVVTDRVDMFGFEGFLEQITPTNPFVYKHGLIQSQATDIDGIATTASNRPDTYYAVYDGDTTSKGKGVNFLALSVIEQDKIANNPKNHIYRMANGDIVQWRIRQRTIAGAGNGDWENLSSIAVNEVLKYKGTTVVMAQGANDSRTDFDFWDTDARIFRSSNNLYVGTNKTLGSFTARNNTAAFTGAINGECYFYVLGTVPRLNQGAYHPSLNPMGSRRFTKTNVIGNVYWYDSNIGTVSKQTCFTNPDSLADGTVGYGSSSGFISSALSGRPDSKYYDAIYASGQGGVIDERMKFGAWDASSAEQAAVVREEVKSGVYRGREKLVYTNIELTEAQEATNTSNAFVTKNPTDLKVGDTAYIVDSNGAIKTSGKITGTYATYVTMDTLISRVIGEVYHVVYSRETDITVEGEFTQTDVIGNPANILQCDALKDGWLGSWVPQIPTGVTTIEYILSRKSLVTAGARVYTKDNGLSWVSQSMGVDIVKNIHSTSALGDNTVGLLQYTATAKQTKPSSNLPVLNGENGLSDVFVSQSFNTLYGSLLFESVLGQINKHSGYATGSYKLIRCGFEVLSGKPYLKSVWNFPTIPLHSEIFLRNQENGGGAGKALFHQSSESEQANLNIIANELIYDSVAGDWGDNSTVKVIASGTFTDDNGNTCKSAIHKLAKPYGWIKNDI